MSGPRPGGFPGPFRRLARQPLRVLAIALLAVTALAAAGIQSAAASVLQATVNANWRGAYDILVTPPDGIAPIDGDLPPNSLASTSEGMTLADLAKVRKVAGVDVAAPIGQILVPDMPLGQAQVSIPESVMSQSAARPQAYRLTETYTTDDGLGERVVTSDTFDLVLDQGAETVSPADLAACEATANITYPGRTGAYRVDPAQYPAVAQSFCAQQFADQHTPICMMPASGSTAGIATGSNLPCGADGQDVPDPTAATVEVTLPDVLQTVTRITLVDPAAEQKLLGKSGGFLDPLIGLDSSGKVDFDAMQRWAASAKDMYAAGFKEFAAPAPNASQPAGCAPVSKATAELKRLYAAHDDDFDSAQGVFGCGIAGGGNGLAGVGEDSPISYVPLIVSQQPVADTTLKLDIQGLGGAAEHLNDATGNVSYDVPGGGAGGARVGTTAGDVSGILNPFVATAQPLIWPGAPVTASVPATTHDISQLINVAEPDPAKYTVAADGTVRLAPTGYLSAEEDTQAAGDPSTGNTNISNQAFTAHADPTKPGSEAIYNDGHDILDDTAKADQTSPTITEGVPIGSFDPAKVADQGAVSYVPLGAYGDVASTIGNGPDKGKTLQPSVTGMGLVSSRTAAIASIDSASVWGLTSPIDAIRVRVGGISGYSAAAVQKVTDVAKAIDKLGLRATVVAGSSLTDANVTVTGYAFGTDDPAGKQTVGNLGTVTQRWSELGAASRVSLSVSTETYLILGIGLAAAILLMGAALLVGIPARREQAAVMRELGFSRARISRWYAAEESPGLAIIALVGAAALWLSGGKPVTQVTVAAAVAAVLAAGVVSVVAGSRRGGARRLRDARSRRIGARSVRGFGAGQARVHALAAVLNGIAVLIVGFAAAGLVAAIVAARAESGQSALALLTLGRVLAPQLALGIAGIVCGVLLARLMRRIDLARRAEQWALLRAAGWTAGQLARAQRTEAATVAVPALVVAAVVAAAGAHWLGLSAPWLYLAVAAGAGAITAVAMAGTPRKGAPA